MRLRPNPLKPVRTGPPSELAVPTANPASGALQPDLWSLQTDLPELETDPGGPETDLADLETDSPATRGASTAPASGCAEGAGDLPDALCDSSCAETDRYAFTSGTTGAAGEDASGGFTTITGAGVRSVPAAMGPGVPGVTGVGAGASTRSVER